MRINPKILSALFVFIFILLFKETDYGNCNSLSKYSKIIEAKNIGQHTDYWCWAAVGQMTMGIDQCVQANAAFELTTCCGSSIPIDCNHRNLSPPFELFGFATDSTDNTPLSWNEIKNQIDNDLPFIGAWWNDAENDDGHLFVVSGYCETENTKKVYVRNPLPLNTGSARWMTFSYYKSGPAHNHGNDYYNIIKK